MLLMLAGTMRGTREHVSLRRAEEWDRALSHLGGEVKELEQTVGKQSAALERVRSDLQRFQRCVSEREAARERWMARGSGSACVLFPVDAAVHRRTCAGERRVTHR